MITTTTPNAAKIFLKGTTIEIASVLLRLEFTAPSNGKTIQVALYPYVDEASFDADPNSIISINGVEAVEEVFAVEAVEASEGVEAVEAVEAVSPLPAFTIKARTYDLSNGGDPETWKAQTIQVAHDEVKAYLDSLGYSAIISGI